MKKIDVLYEDDISIIINKPAGLAVQGGKNVKLSIDKILASYCAAGSCAPLLVHRLDKDTSGALLAAKGSQAAARFTKIFGAERKAVKIYTAVCAGHNKQDKGVITDKLVIHGKVKDSNTAYKVIKKGALADINFEYSVLELEPGTGRVHQIRRHLAMNGTPILGDDKYGDFKLNKNLLKTAGLKRLLLHASRLIIKEFGIDVTAPPPEYFNKWLFL